MLTWDWIRQSLMDAYQDVTSHLVSRLVLIGSWFVFWIALVEIMSHLTGIPMLPLTTGFTRYSLAVFLLWIAAPFIVYLSFSLSLALVVEKDKAELEEPRHIAYAWSCGLTGVVVLAIEVFGGLDFQFEDPLLAMAGLNTLVEEVRLRIAQAGGSTRDWV